MWHHVPLKETCSIYHMEIQNCEVEGHLTHSAAKFTFRGWALILEAWPWGNRASLCCLPGPHVSLKNARGNGNGCNYLQQTKWTQFALLVWYPTTMKFQWYKFSLHGNMPVFKYSFSQCPWWTVPVYGLHDCTLRCRMILFYFSFIRDNSEGSQLSWGAQAPSPVHWAGKAPLT